MMPTSEDRLQGELNDSRKAYRGDNQNGANDSAGEGCRVGGHTHVNSNWAHLTPAKLQGRL